MNFQAHLQGGLVAGSIAVGVALGTGYAEWQSDAWQATLPMAVGSRGQHPFASQGQSWALNIAW